MRACIAQNSGRANSEQRAERLLLNEIERGSRRRRLRARTRRDF